MKTILTLITLAASGSLLVAEPKDAKAIIVMEDDAQQVWMTGADATRVQFKETEVAIDQKIERRSNLVSVFFYQPELFKEAKAMYENRDYAGAKEKFLECQEAYKRVEEVPGNYSTLSAFYALECTRKLGELEELASMLENFRSGALVRESHKSQLEVYVAWDAVRTKSWPRLVGLTSEMLAQKRWTGSQLAQLFYCRGLALEGVNRPIDALNAFNGACTADFTASEEITRKAVLNCLRIIKGHEEVQLAMKLFGTEDEDPNSTGYSLLQEGVALCELWDTALGGGQPLPSEFKALLKFKAKTS